MKTILAALFCLLSFCAHAQYYSPTPINGWINQDSPLRVYKAQPGGVVQVEGMVCKQVSSTPPGSGLCGGSITNPELVAILPDGYKPTYPQRFPIVADFQLGTMFIYPTGELYVTVPSGFWVSLTASYFAP